jgi:hypothetical protein
MADVVREIYAGHTAFAELMLDLVPVLQRTANSRQF